MSTLPRPGLSFSQKRKLEDQFGAQVPEFSEYHQKRRGLESFSVKGAALAGIGSCIFAYQRSYQPLTGIFVGAMAFLTARSAAKYFGAPYFGVNSINNAEFDRAFNLWVYYEHNPYRKDADLPIHQFESRYQKRLNEFREKHKNDYTQFLKQ
ncbi:hypothetical protein FDP41_005390 [Naegleria fowleri]|uniref:Uncharacterized protein n=1 Tax=Naegleria fowleri TaxID=5763 RepID=A0A6A5BKH6_NAEFO|nr:uncharacterized protein FDP41_005390 [Naegleria fowleri]KAF0975396.1 hypothetical protein FDP41_005390 [Naegleria fowleri]CAG4708865.1 unnamed protein product [Naegleria fowleri]